MRADRVTRAVRVEGLTTPAFIRNGDHHFINLPVFADGLVDCWELVDLALFKEKLDQGWVSVAPPAGASIFAFQCGGWKVAEPRWELTPALFHQRVLDLLRTLNPRMENLHACNGRTFEERDGVRVSILGVSTPVPARQSEPGFRGHRVDGESLDVLVARGSSGDCDLVDLRVFSDGVVQLGRLAEPRTMDLDALRAAVADGRMFAAPSKGARVHIHGLGSFTVAEAGWAIEPAERLRDVFDRVEKLNGRPTSSARCQQAHRAYLQDPTPERKEALRAAYEAVPKHNRAYLMGDMDAKDYAIRKVLYGDKGFP